jgi:simple sugar transport system ATP-binding protein
VRVVDEVSFAVRAGELVGVAGVAGNGQSELLVALAGMRPIGGGAVRLCGRDLPESEREPHRLRELGILHVPEDRLRTGLVPSLPAFESAALGFIDDPRFGRGPFLDHGRMVADLAANMASYDVRPAAPHLKTAKFSGGNQQKIVLAREIERAPTVLLVGQPTRGVDIGAIELIHRRLIALRDSGVAILLVSVELEEILALSDRVLAMCGGRITGERRPETASEREIGLLMAGVGEAA